MCTQVQRNAAHNYKESSILLPKLLGQCSHRICIILVAKIALVALLVGLFQLLLPHLQQHCFCQLSANIRYHQCKLCVSNYMKTILLCYKYYICFVTYMYFHVFFESYTILPFLQRDSWFLKHLLARAFHPSCYLPTSTHGFAQSPCKTHVCY